MYCIGQINPQARRLVDTTYQAMRAGIRQVRPDARLSDIGQAIQQIAEQVAFSVVVREYTGHGITKNPRYCITVKSVVL